MVRPTQFLHPQREPAPTRPAATALFLRDTAQGLQVLMTRRSGKASFAPDAYVFPGGTVDAEDAASHPMTLCRDQQEGEGLTHAIAAIRESFEELGILLVRHADGSPLDRQEIAAFDRQRSLVEQCKERDLKLAADELFRFARWITGRDRPKRFDTSFMVARMPEWQEPVADNTEQFDPVWVHPVEAAQRHEAGNFSMIFPTRRTLEWLATFDTVDAALRACASDQPQWTSCVRGGSLNGSERRFMEHEKQYAELALVSPDDHQCHRLDWRHDEPVALLKNVMRLTAQNSSVMTGPGTNTYIVGDASSGYIVIDPGPALPAHIDRIFSATGGDVRMIVCTHSHADHSPGAQPLQQLCPGKPPILGMNSLPTAHESHFFIADRELADGEEISLGAGASRHTLRAIRTPGHAANHVCLLLVEDGLLFTGDHILSGTTTIVNPPDGDMTDYLESLDKLAQACLAGGVEFMLPAHGHVLGDPQATIAALKNHRLWREEKVLAAMQAQPEGSLADWRRMVYLDIPEKLWPMAERSLLAHVLRIKALAK